MASLTALRILHVQTSYQLGGRTKNSTFKIGTRGLIVVVPILTAKQRTKTNMVPEAHCCTWMPVARRRHPHAVAVNNIWRGALQR